MDQVSIGPTPVTASTGLRRGPPEAATLLDVRDLRTYFHVMDGTVLAVNGDPAKPVLWKVPA